jgi:fucose permease
MSIRQSGVPVGGALAGVLVPLLLLVSDWKAAARTIAALCIFCMFALQAVRQRYDSVHRDARLAPRPSVPNLFRMVFAHAELRQGALASFAYGGMQWCLASFLVVFLTERAELSLINAGFALSAAMIGGIVGRLLWGLVADHIGNARAVLGGLGVVMSLSALVMSQVTSGWPLLAVVILSVTYGATAIGWNGVYVAEIARIVPAGQVALATGASLAFTYFGVVVMPFLFWLIVTVSTSYAIAFAAAATLTLLAALSYFHHAA